MKSRSAGLGGGGFSAGCDPAASLKRRGTAKTTDRVMTTVKAVRSAMKDAEDLAAQRAAFYNASAAAAAADNAEAEESKASGDGATPTFGTPTFGIPVRAPPSVTHSSGGSGLGRNSEEDATPSQVPQPRRQFLVPKLPKRDFRDLSEAPL